MAVRCVIQRSTRGEIRMRGKKERGSIFLPVRFGCLDVWGVAATTPMPGSEAVVTYIKKCCGGVLEKWKEESLIARPGSYCSA